MNKVALFKTLYVMGEAVEFNKTASSEDTVLTQLGDVFIKLAEENDNEGLNFKVANLINDVIFALGLDETVDREDFVKKAATAEIIYNKLSDSDKVVERDMAKLANMHINALFVKLAQLASGYGVPYQFGVQNPQMALGNGLPFQQSMPDYGGQYQQDMQVAMPDLSGASLGYTPDMGQDFVPQLASSQVQAPSMSEIMAHMEAQRQRENAQRISNLATYGLAALGAGMTLPWIMAKIKGEQ